MRIRFVILFVLAASLLIARSGHADENDGHPIYEIPKLDNITVDDQPNDWGDSGFRIEALVDDAHQTRKPSAFDATCRLAWNDRGLLALVRVWDDSAVESDKDTTLWAGDSVEFFLTPKRGSPEIWQAIVSPGVDGKHRDLRQHVYHLQKSESLQKMNAPATFARTKAPGGYFLEALLPWANVGVTPEMGGEVGFQICINDHADGGSYRACWYPRPDTAFNPLSVQRLKLSDHASSPLQVGVGAHIEHFRRTRLKVLASEELVGKPVEVRDGEKVLGTAVLASQSEEGCRTRAYAAIVFPPPSAEKPYGPLSVLIDGKPVAHFDLMPLSGDTRPDDIAEMDFQFQPPVFTDEAFPSGDFENVWEMEDLIGPYTIDITFYNADFEPVKSAAKPGRYGAIVAATADDGRVYKRFKTLFRQPGGKIYWPDQNAGSELKMPAELGIDPVVLREHQHVLEENIHELMNDSFRKDSDEAILAAGLFETKPGAGKWDSTNDAWAMDTQWWYTLRQKTGNAEHYSHLDFVPPDYGRDAQKKWPLILFLHGSGERGSDLKMVENSFHMITQAGTDHPFIVVAPQCPGGEYWNPLVVNDLLDEVMAKYHVDPDRVYLTGLSMGGFGTWYTAFQFPERFAAIAPLSGGGDPNAVDHIKNLPTWIFHGGDDPQVDLRHSREMWDALKKIGAPARFTIYPGYLHEIWAETYSNPELYKWLLQQRRGHPQQGPATQPMIPAKTL